MIKRANVRGNHNSHKRWSLEATLSRGWLKENLPEVFTKIQTEALSRFPRSVRKVKGLNKIGF